IVADLWRLATAPQSARRREATSPLLPAALRRLYDDRVLSRFLSDERLSRALSAAGRLCGRERDRTFAAILAFLRVNLGLSATRIPLEAIRELQRTTSAKRSFTADDPPGDAIRSALILQYEDLCRAIR